MSGQDVRDLPSKADILDRVRVHDGSRPVERIRLRPEGRAQQSRDVVRAGRVAAVIAYDPTCDVLVMLRQFRLPAHLAHGRGLLVEIVAGRADGNEDIAETARRECIEEIGLEPRQLQLLFRYLPSPGYTDEEVTVFLGLVDSRHMPAQAGLENESEYTLPMAVARADAIAALDAGYLSNGITVTALHWLARHGGDLTSMVETLE